MSLFRLFNDHLPKSRPEETSFEFYNRVCSLERRVMKLEKKVAKLKGKLCRVKRK